MSDEYPESKNIRLFEGGDYLLTAASWKTSHGYLSYEIGIRHKETGDFTLIQSEKYNHQSVQEVAGAMAHILQMSKPPMTEHYTPEWLREYFS